MKDPIFVILFVSFFFFFFGFFLGGGSLYLVKFVLKCFKIPDLNLLVFVDYFLCTHFKCFLKKLLIIIPPILLKAIRLRRKKMKKEVKERKKQIEVKEKVIYKNP